MKYGDNTRQFGNSRIKSEFDFGAVQPGDELEVHTNKRSWKLSPTLESVLDEDTVTGVRITINGNVFPSQEKSPDTIFVNRFFKPGGILTILGDETDEVVQDISLNGEPVEFRH